MSPDETPEETPETEEPKRRRRRRASADAPASESPRSEAQEESESEATRGDSAADASPEAGAVGGEAAEIEPTGEDVAAVEAAADVMLEADAEAEGEADDDEPDAEAEVDSEDEVDEHEAEEAPAPASSRRRRRRGATEEEAPPPAPAPTRRRRGERAPGPPPVVRAQAKYVRSSARKARLVCDHIRGKSVEEARAILAHTSRAVARDWSKLLESAVANAENNHELVGEDLYVKAVHADEGPTIRRFRPRAMGRATRIRKRTSHLTILLTPKD
jgi:ribosomal protein L22